MKNSGLNTSCANCDFSCVKKFFTDDDIKVLDQNKSIVHFEKGKTILKQGTFVSQIAFLKKGIIKKVIEGKNEKNTILKLVDENHYIALPVLGNPVKYPFSIVAVEDCEICFIRKEAMIDIIKSNIALNNFLLSWYSDDYLYMYQKIDLISTRNSHGKLAGALIYLSNLSQKKDVLNSISRKELAELASVSIESTNKILLELKHDKIININKNGIEILRPDLIEKLSTVG